MVSIQHTDEISDYEDSVAILRETPSSFLKELQQSNNFELGLEVFVVGVVVLVAAWSAVVSTHS